MSLPIGFFSPLPLPIMVPFMFMQSAAMALGFGSFFQYGKRRISSMSNDEFNKLTPEALTANLMSSINGMIPTVHDSFHQMEQMNVMILDAMAKYFDQATSYLFKWIKGGASQAVTNFQNEGQQILDDTGISDFLNSGGQLLPSAGAEETYSQPGITTSKLNAIENYASRWINPPNTYLNNITFKEISYLLQMRAEGKLFPNFKALGSILLKKYDSLKPKPKTQQQVQTVIDKTSTGVVKQIATMWNNLKSLMKEYQRYKDRKRSNAFLLAAKKYNQFVAANRKPKLQINTDLSIRFFTLVPKK